jgi:hypothetical protein
MTQNINSKYFLKNPSFKFDYDHLDHGIAKEFEKDIVFFWHKVFTKWLTLTLWDFKKNLVKAFVCSFGFLKL